MSRKVFLLLILLAGLVCHRSAVADKGDYVVLLHGIGRTSNTMYLIEKFFEKDGYAVLNLDYPSREYTLAEIVEKIHPQIDAFVTDDTKPVHFVGYSMGGLVIRAYVAKYRPLNMGRVVMMGVPNTGSEAADAFHSYKLYEKVYGPAGRELMTKTDNDKIFSKVDYEVGTIAGTLSIDPVSSFIIPGQDDGKVSVVSSRLEGEKDHLTMYATHTFMPLNQNVIKAAKHFIDHGVFPPETN